MTYLCEKCKDKTVSGKNKHYVGMFPGNIDNCNGCKKHDL